jgi:hypothetical protein
LLTPDEKGDAVKRIAIILGIAVFPSVAQNENRRVAQNDEVRSFTTTSNVMKRSTTP